MARRDHRFVAATGVAISSGDEDDRCVNKVGVASGWTYPSGRSDRGCNAIVAEEKVSYHSIAPGSSASATPTAATTTASSTTSRHLRGDPDRLRTATTTAWNDQLSPQAVRRLCCDAVVSRIVMAGSQVIDVGRATRDWSEPQRRAINVRDRGCRGPSCFRPIVWTQIHHVQWWRREGRTAVDNGRALCHHCQRLVHDHGWTVAFDPETGSASWMGRP